ncbi:hypothetical protein MKEN_00171700 [Mycena kentingensis (nom. inval.)]|nr:hypothetical protein MKEN_00171700 [Mycena kentingensis (nom. inval.)]
MAKMARPTTMNYTANRALRPLLSTAAPERVRQLLDSVDWSKDYSLSALARKTIESHLEAHKAYVAERSVQASVPSLVDLASNMVPSSLRSEQLASIPEHLWEGLPYPVLRRVVKLAATPEGPAPKRPRGQGASHNILDIDEWILTNEKKLVYTKHRPGGDWRNGLVNLSDAEAIFPDSVLTHHGRVITRPSTMSGHLMLGALRHPNICIQTSISSFKTRFERLTGGLLNGLDWTNVFVAGGIVLGALHAPESPASLVKDEDLQSSDVDIYIYGLDSKAATAKVKEIFRTYRKNLPRGAPTVVVRNSKTITFYSKYPTRRIQIVLRFLKTPKHVLLNFDLDICALGYDGTEVWMLPRAARALETGYNVFTMSLVQGHYLSERRATQEERVFKYAYRGYGIRILPLYIASLPTSQDKVDAIKRGERLLPLDLEYLANRSRTWTKRVIVAISYHSEEMPRVNPTDLENGDQISSEPLQYSCLTGFSLFMRHVALWEMERRGEVIIEHKTWAVASYGEDSPLAYDDTPYYTWDEHFDLNEFKKSLDNFNNSLTTGWIHTHEEVADFDLLSLEDPHYDFKDVKRVTYAKDADGVLVEVNDVSMPVILPANFAEYANELLEAVMIDAGMDAQRSITRFDPNDEFGDDEVDENDARLHLYIWRIPLGLIWQEMDRRKDEVYEVLYAFYRTHARIERDPDEAPTRLVSQLSRRVIDPEVEDEFAAFARWIGRRPIFTGYFYNGGDENLVANPETEEEDLWD